MNGLCMLVAQAKESAEYFTAAFGENGKAVADYLAEISTLACPPYVRGNIIVGYKDFTKEELEIRYGKIKELADAFCKKFEALLDSSADWQYLKVHSVLVKLFADIYIAKAYGDEEKITELSNQFRETVNAAERIIDAVCDDMYLCDDVCKKFLERH